MSQEYPAQTEMQQQLRLLDQVRVASPCQMKWDEMDGDERKRFCGLCRQSVFNLSDMTDAEAEALILEKGAARLCINYYQRPDGTIITRDCKGGAQTGRRSFLVTAAVALLTCMVALVAAVTAPVRAANVSQPNLPAIQSNVKAKVAGMLRRVPALRPIADQLDPMMVRGEMILTYPPVIVPSGKP